jgi:hypothetical protein
LEQIPITFKNYYNLLGPVTLKACGYNRTNIRKKLEINQSNEKKFEDLLNMIYDNFLIGQKYLLSNIKLLLGDIYKKSNYIASPKASDLEKYFEVKLFKITNKETRKRVPGYEILKKKDQL